MQNNSGETKNNQPETTIKIWFANTKQNAPGTTQNTSTEHRYIPKNKTYYKQVYKPPRKHPSKKSPPHKNPIFKPQKPNPKKGKITLFRFPPLKICKPPDHVQTIRGPIYIESQINDPQASHNLTPQGVMTTGRKTLKEPSRKCSSLAPIV